MSRPPQFVVVSFAQAQAEILTQGFTSPATLQELFVDPYALEGERYHPGKDAVIRGVLIASDETTVVTVPIWTWTGEDGAARLLCQASDDGSPPAFSVFSLSERDLVEQIKAAVT